MTKQKKGKMSDLTAERLREVLEYDPITGLFRWKVATARHNMVGSIAGCRSGFNGYCEIGLDGHLYKGHRLAWLYMTGTWPKAQIDHRDTVRSNNNWDNLREATPCQNSANQGKRKINRSGYKGVSWDKNAHKWKAAIMSEGRRVFLGYFDTAKDAHAAYEEEALNLHGNYARTR